MGIDLPLIQAVTTHSSIMMYVVMDAADPKWHRYALIRSSLMLGDRVEMMTRRRSGDRQRDPAGAGGSEFGAFLRPTVVPAEILPLIFTLVG